MNKWIVTGRLVANAEFNATDSGNLVASMRVAITRDYKSKETGKREADFFLLKAFGKTADNINTFFQKAFVVKGDLLEFEIKPQNNNYEKDGKKVYQDTYIIQSVGKLASINKNNPDI